MYHCVKFSWVFKEKYRSNCKKKQKPFCKAQLCCNGWICIKKTNLGNSAVNSHQAPDKAYSLVLYTLELACLGNQDFYRLVLKNQHWSAMKTENDYRDLQSGSDFFWTSALGIFRKKCYKLVFQFSWKSTSSPSQSLQFGLQFLLTKIEWVLFRNQGRYRLVSKKNVYYKMVGPNHAILGQKLSKISLSHCGSSLWG